ncbi:MAG: 16S rRNA (cytosine1402-N4)-methyltransferase [Planctomycetota bacterium]|jgi:16S rRNA (cytosine1402-N4)-methyltransferase
MSEDFGHVSVLADEALEFLDLKPGNHVCDLTLGAGGHSQRILEAIGSEGRLIAFDQDPIALGIAKERLAPYLDQVQLVEANFSEADRCLRKYKWDALDGALLDVGVSSMQVDDASRGFSFSKPGPLDMRMSPSAKRTAETLLANSSAEELERIFREYGEEPRARVIASKIVEVRRRIRLTTTKELAELVRTVAGSGGKKTHPATRVFQALRIAINGELDVLNKVLPILMDRLRPTRRLVVISFHSLEDRIVKQAMRAAADSGLGTVLTKKPVGPGREELARNPRSRSARLRVFEKGEPRG